MFVFLGFIAVLEFVCMLASVCFLLLVPMTPIAIVVWIFALFVSVAGFIQAVLIIQDNW